MSDVEHVEEETLSSDVIEPAEEVRKRWSEENHAFARRLKQHNFQLFFLHGPPRRAPDGKRVFIGTRGTTDNLDCEYGPDDDDIWCSLNGVCLLRSEVESHETKHPHLKYPTISDNKNNDDSGITQDKYNYITSDDLCKRWSMSPAQLVETINNNNDLVVYFGRVIDDFTDVPF